MRFPMNARLISKRYLDNAKTLSVGLDQNLFQHIEVATFDIDIIQNPSAI